MINRTLEDKIRELSTQFPVIEVTGPRQSGKTTLVKKCFPDYEYYNLEDPNTRSLIESDPKQFVNPDKTRIIFDEVQRFPDLLSYIQVTVDETGLAGEYVISGSQNLLLSEKVSQSLAGRVAIATLLPFSNQELKSVDLLSPDAFSQIQKGYYPRIYNQSMDPVDFYGSYLATYVERDVRQIKNIGDISTFQRFMQLLAGRVGQLFNANSLANDLGVDSKTVKSWLNILEASYIAYRLPPYFANYGKRLIKSSKVYFYDVGLLAYLLGVDTEAEINTHFARGGMFENLVISEVKKLITNHGYNIRPYFWRDSNGNEVDLLLDRGSSIDAIEIKSSSGFKSEFTKGLEYWDSLDHKLGGSKFLVYNDDMQQQVKSTQLVNWAQLHEFIKQ